MSKSGKRSIRKDFRNKVLARDCFACRLCGDSKSHLDAHHITDRSLMPNGGYVLENGITVCPTCHSLVEEFHSSGGTIYTIHPSTLSNLIGSSYERAFKASSTN